MQNPVKLSLQNIASPTSTEEMFQATYQFFFSRLNLFNVGRLFFNKTQYLQALNQDAEGSIVIQMRRGLNFTVRRNIWDAKSIDDVFVGRPLFQRIRLGKKPTILEIGGYVGSFSIYAILTFQAARVVTYESSIENFRLLSQNIVNNGLDHRITPIHGTVESLESVLNQHQLEQVDLLRVDGSRDSLRWLLNTPHQVLHQIHRVVLKLPAGGSPTIAPALAHLKSAGYSVRQGKGWVYALRPGA